MTRTPEITEFHAHVYFDAVTRAKAERLRTELPSRFVVALGAWRDAPVGPHTKAMYQVSFAPDVLGPLVSWLLSNRDGLSILVHPMTGDELADHSTHALWLGEPLPLRREALR